MTGVIHVFAGPSLPRAVRPVAKKLVFHAPAAQGDIYSLVASKPFAIGLVDGYFERVPAVWHKEILWALSEGVHVFGAASMGALRAAELADFGMVGIGTIFEDFARGALQDDDEVTLAHAEADADYRPGSEAQVNIRATLAAAQASGLVLELEVAQLLAHSKSTFYPDRNYADLALLAQQTLPDDRAARLAGWLRNPGNHVDLKRREALSLISALLELRERKPGPKQVSWTFHHTDAWEQVRRTFLVPRVVSTDVSGGGETNGELEPSSKGSHEYEELRALANLRACRAELARRDGFSPTAADLTKQAAELAQRNGFSDAAGLRAWMAERGVEAPELERLLRDEASAANAELIRASGEDQALHDYLQTRCSQGPGQLQARERQAPFGTGNSEETR
jgi:hypothetical protein